MTMRIIEFNAGSKDKGESAEKQAKPLIIGVEDSSVSQELLAHIEVMISDPAQYDLDENTIPVVFHETYTKASIEHFLAQNLDHRRIEDTPPVRDLMLILPNFGAVHGVTEDIKQTLWQKAYAAFGAAARSATVTIKGSFTAQDLSKNSRVRAFIDAVIQNPYVQEINDMGKMLYVERMGFKDYVGAAASFMPGPKESPQPKRPKFKVISFQNSEPK